jgi:hypothetical protein
MLSKHAKAIGLTCPFQNQLGDVIIVDIDQGITRIVFRIAKLGIILQILDIKSHEALI